MRALSSRNTKTSAANSNGGSPRPPRGAKGNASGARYDVLDRVGEGTLFVVYRVREKNSNRLLALKALKNNFNAHPQFASALAQALTEAANFSHPFLAKIEEVGREDGTLFQLQEWLLGQTLEARLRRAPFGRIETVSSARSIAEALQYLHENGEVHGDLRPRQMISGGDGQLKLTDYNLSSAFRAANLSPADVLLDAVGYTAPELIVAAGQNPAQATPQSDLYALGVILYRMLTGRAPFDGPTPVAIATRHRNDTPLPPSRFNPHCAPDLEAIALRLLQKKPNARFNSASELLQELDGAASANFVASTSNVSIPAASMPAVSAEAFTGSAGESAPDAVISGKEVVSEPMAANAIDTTKFSPVSARTQPLPHNESSPLATTPTGAATSSTRSASTGNPGADDDFNSDASSDVNARNDALFPATMPIHAVANAPLAALKTKVAATAVPATLASSAAVAASVSAPVASSVAGAPVLPPTAQDMALDAAEEKKAIKKHRRREAWGAVFAFLWIWVAVGLLGGMIYSSYDWWVKQTPKDVVVPSYLGKNEADVKNVLAKAGLKMNVVGEVYDPRRAEGTVIRGFPPAGKKVKPARLVDVTVSRGAEKVVMPDLSELDLSKVRQVLQQAGMRLGNISTMYHDKIARGYICGQYPQPGDAFSRSEPINLVISRGPQPAAVLNPAKTQTPATNAKNAETQNEAQTLANSIAPADLPDTQNPPVGGQNTPVNDASPFDDNSPSDSSPIITRTVRISVPVPQKDGAKQREVRIVVQDADGENVIYDDNCAPGEQVDRDVPIKHAQGGSATVLVYIDDVLQKQQLVR